jgi:hypothetical protein
MYTKYIDHICPPSPSPFIFPLPTGTRPKQDPIIFYVYINWGLAMVFHTCIYSLIRLTLSVAIFLNSPAPLLLNSFQCILLCYLHTQMQRILILFTLYHFLFLSCLPLVPSNSLPVSNMIYVSTYLSMRSYMYLCIHLSFRSSFYIWEENMWPLPFWIWLTLLA